MKHIQVLRKEMDVLKAFFDRVIRRVPGSGIGLASPGPDQPLPSKLLTFVFFDSLAVFLDQLHTRFEF